MSSTAKSRYDVGVFTLPSAVVFVLTGIGLVLYFRYEKQQLAKKKEQENAAQMYGRPKVGGPFSLTAYTAAGGDGTPFTDANLLGKWSLLYFGFTNCPDICPAELDKVTEVVKGVDAIHGPITQPVFVTVDPSRDSGPAISQYLQDFHPRFVGLRGEWDAVKSIARAYRVYFSTPAGADPTGDYLVDHSIFVYLMDPEGAFVDAFGQNLTAEEMGGKIDEAIRAWEGVKGRKV